MEKVFVKIYNGWKIYKLANGEYMIEPKHMNPEDKGNDKRFASMGEVKRFINKYR